MDAVPDGGGGKDPGEPRCRWDHRRIPQPLPPAPAGPPLDGGAGPAVLPRAAAARAGSQTEAEGGCMGGEFEQHQG